MGLKVIKVEVHDNATCQTQIAYDHGTEYPVYITVGANNIHFPEGSITIQNVNPVSIPEDKATLRLLDAGGKIIYEETTSLNYGETLSNSNPIYLDMPKNPTWLYVVAGKYTNSSFIEDDRATVAIVPNYTLTVQSSPTGAPFTKDSLQYITPHTQSLPLETTVTVEAAKEFTTPEGITYVFLQWEDGSTDPTRQITMISNKTITAYYVPMLELTIIATEGGTTDPAPGTYTYSLGSTVTVTAIPNPGYKFSHWLLDGQTRSQNPIQLVMIANYTLTAVFVQIVQYTLTISVNDPTMGTTNPPPGTYTYEEGSTVTVQATPAKGYKFSYWLLDGETRTENPITITMDKDHTLVAVFTQIVQYTLTINVNDPTLGTTNPPPGTYTYEEGSTVTVQAIPKAGARFSHWQLDGETRTENPITIYMDKDYMLTAYFETAPPPKYATLTGTVKGLFNQPVKGATVKLNNIYSAITDASGRYTIQNITPGSYTLTVSHPLYETKVMAVSLSEPTTYTIDVTLQFKTLLITASLGVLSAIFLIVMWRRR